jgi:Flp pilus assembly protein TadD
VRDNGFFYLGRDANTLAEVLLASGFRTGAVVGGYPLARHYGLDQGFSVYDDELPQGGSAGLELGYPERSAGEVTERAIELVKQWLGSSFLLWVHYFDPHAPYTPPEPPRGMSSYMGELAYVDRELRRLVAALPEGSLVIVTADHGEGLGDHGEATHGNYLYDTTTRIPLVLAGPRVPSMLRLPDIVSIVDVGPTVLEWCGIPPPTPWQGRSLWPLMEGDTSGTRPVYFETLHPWHRYGWPPKRGIRLGTLTYVVDEGEALSRRNGPATREDLEEARAAMATFCDEESFSPREAGPDEVRFLAELGYLADDGGARAHVLSILDRADNALVEGNLTAALALYEQALDLDSGNPHALRASGIARVRMGDLGGAEALFRLVLARRPDDVAAMENLAVVLFDRGRGFEAESLFRGVLDRLPMDTTAREFLAEIRHGAGDYAGAAELYEELCRLRPDEPRYHRDAGAVYAYQLGLPDLAIRHWARALDLDPTGPQSSTVRRELARLRGGH